MKLGFTRPGTIDDRIPRHPYVTVHGGRTSSQLMTIRIYGLRKSERNMIIRGILYPLC